MAAASVVRLQAAIAAHLACAHEIEGFDEVARAVACATSTGDELDNAVAHMSFWQLTAEQRVAVKDAYVAMDAALRRLNQRSLRRDVGDAIASAKIRAMCPHAGDDGIEVPLIDGISYAQLAQLSASLGTAEIYVDIAPGDSDSTSVPGRVHAVLTIRWPP